MLQHTKTCCTHNKRARDSAPDYIQTEGKKFPKSVSSNCSWCNPSPSVLGLSDGGGEEQRGSLESSTRFTLIQLRASHTHTYKFNINTHGSVPL